MKSRTKALARRLRKGSRLASLTAEISSGIEKVAEYSDRIIENFGEAEHRLSEVTVQVREGTGFLKSLSGSAGEVRRSGGEHIAAVEDSSGAFRRISAALRDILSSIQNITQSHSEVVNSVQELVKQDETIELISGQLARMAERSDLAAVNAALEAVKAGDRGAEFGALASAAQRYTAAFVESAGEFAALLGTMASVHRTLHGKTGEASERIRAVGVMTKGVRNAYDEAAESFDALRRMSSDITGGIERIVSCLDSIVAETERAASGVERAVVSIHHAVSLLEEQETIFTGAADHAETLLDATGRLAAEEDTAAALDDIYTATDAFIRSVEATMERFDLLLSAIRDAANEMDLLRRDSVIGGNALKPPAEAVSAAVETAERFNGLLTRLQTSIAESLDILRNVARELDLLAREGDAIGCEVEKLKQPYRAVSRFGGRLEAFSVRMGCIAAGIGVEAARAHGGAGAFSSFPGDFDSVAAESVELERTVVDLADRLSDHFSAISGKHSVRNWKETVSAFSGVITEVEDLLNSRFAALSSRNASLSELLTDQRRKIEKIMTKSAAAGLSAEHANRTVNEALTAGENERTAFLEIIATAEKMTAIADELYPEEE